MDENTKITDKKMPESVIESREGDIMGPVNGPIGLDIGTTN